MSTIILFFAILGLLILVHEGGHFFAAKRSGVKVHEFGIGFPPRIFMRKYGETEYSLNLLPLGGFVRIEGEDGDPDSKGADTNRSFASKPLLTKLIIVLAGVAMNWLLAALLLGALQTMGAPISIPDTEIDDNASVMITSVSTDSPASEVGLRPGDTIISLKSNNPTEVTTVSSVQKFLGTRLGEEVSISIVRGSEEITLLVTPRVNPPENEGALGVSLARVTRISYPWYEGLWRGVFVAVSMTITLVVGFYDVISMAFSGGGTPDALTGPIGIAVLTGEFKQLGLPFLINFIAILSLNLAILNIIPFPALDGGRAVLALYERLRGKVLSQRFLGRINATGFAILILAVVAITIRDIQKYFL